VAGRATAPRARLTAAERREDVLVAAVAEFARTGYHGTPTEAIARGAGISHAYLFRLYPTKKELFLACVERVFDQVQETFRVAAHERRTAETALGSMGDAYIEMLDDRELLLFQLQTYAAAADDDVRALAQRRYAELIEEITRLSGGADDDEIQAFWAKGMLLNVRAALELG
jgi:AcrR family transcriptional regulator